MKLRNIFVLAAIVFAFGSLAVREFRSRETTPQNGEGQSKGEMIRVSVPTANATISSPLSVSGEARGYWYFEASFPVRIKDAQGNILGTGVAQAQGEWMTESFVPFTATVQFQSDRDQSGFVVFEKDNPSGLPEHAAEVSIPVRIKKNNR